MLFSVFCPDLPPSKMIFSTTLRTHFHWQTCRRKTNCLETFILLSSLPIISTTGEKLQSGRQMIQTYRVFTSFLPTRKHFPSCASKCTSLLLHLPDATKTLTGKVIQLNQFKIEDVYPLRNLKSTGLMIHDESLSHPITHWSPSWWESPPQGCKFLCEVRGGEVRSGQVLTGCTLQFPAQLNATHNIWQGGCSLPLNKGREDIRAAFDSLFLLKYLWC